MHKFHNILDCKLKRLADRLHGLLQHQDTDRYWALWNHIIEEAFCEQFVPDLADRKRYKGMGAALHQEAALGQSQAAQP